MTRHYLTAHRGNWYVVPVDKSEEWEEWLSLDSDDQRSWALPDYVQAAGRWPSAVSFSDPEIP